MNTDNPDNSPGGQTIVPPALQSEVKQDLGKATDQAKHDLGKATDQAKHDLDAIKQRGADDLHALQHEAGAQVKGATDKAKSFADDQKDLAAGQVNGVASAINKVADELDGTDQQTVGRYARDLASGLSGLGKTIEDRDVDDLMGMAQDFGRKQPVAFLGAAALAGFVASRFALASNHRRDTKPAASPSATAASKPGDYDSAAPIPYGAGPSGTVRPGGR
tara:strand:+ start:5336 stop:5995 length:660 start_codon:yes stop_codon:yes gene_type:complete